MEREADAVDGTEARLRAVQDALPYGFALHRPIREGGRATGTVVDFELSYVNRAGARVLGAEAESIIGRTLLELFPGTDAEGVFAGYARTLDTGEPYVHELMYERDGISVGLSITAVRVEDDELAVTFLDVSRRLRARGEVERLLGESERARAEAEASRERLEAVLASIADAFYLLDREWRFIYVNAAAEPLLQTTRERLIGRTLWEAFPGVVGSPFEGPYREAMATGRATSAEAYFPPLGTWFDVHTYAWAGGLMVHFRDIGARKSAEADRERLIGALETAQRRVAFLAAASAALAESLDPEAVLRTVAQLAIGTADAPGLADACVVTLAGPEEAKAGRWRTLIEGIDPAKVALEVERQRRFPASPEGMYGFPAVIRTGRSELVTPEMMEAQLRGVASADASHWAYFAALDLYSAVTAPLVARGRTLGALTLVRHGPGRRGALDADDLALAEELSRRAAVALDNARLYAAAQQSRAEAESAHDEAEAARAAAETANRAKAEFLATMSHELRTPLNAIGGYAELMEMGIRGPVSPHQVEDLRRIQASQRHLLGLVNEVLNYARIETGTVRYDIGDVPLAAVVASVEPLIAPQVATKGLVYTHRDLRRDLHRDARHGGQATLVARADREKVRQVLLNLLSNAIKFTEAPGAIDVWSEAVGDRVVVRVRDSGLGIAPDELERIFEPFVQVNARLTRTQEGTGLGLAISRDLARGMGGDLTVESVVGEGSTFTLELPRAAR